MITGGILVGLVILALFLKSKYNIGLATIGSPFSRGQKVKSHHDESEQAQPLRSTCAGGNLSAPVGDATCAEQGTNLSSKQNAEEGAEAPPSKLPEVNPNFKLYPPFGKSA